MQNERTCIHTQQESRHRAYSGHESGVDGVPLGLRVGEAARLLQRGADVSDPLFDFLLLQKYHPCENKLLYSLVCIVWVQAITVECQ